MPVCKICLKSYQNLRYRSSRVCICGRCTNDLNRYNQVAEDAYHEARQMLERGIIRRAQSDLLSPKPSWIHERAMRLLQDPSIELERAFPGWVNGLVANPANRSKIFKIIRAERRGLLHLDRPHRWGYPKNWAEVAKAIRKLDRFTCVACNATGVELHVHHIVYASNYGTHQKANLVTLCRSCHELEHKRVFDTGENMANTDLVPED
ncbi:HNH endonuclease [Pseudomonas sp. R2.Fl]|nr:HNH endonuclease [Pseudomonas sp. R2.Fl]